MQNSLAFGTAPHPARHAATLACDAGRRVMTSADLSGALLSHPGGALPRSLRKVTTGNPGNAANLIFLRIRAPHRQKGSGKCGNPLRCRFYRCFCRAVAGCLPLAETCGNSPLETLVAARPVTNVSATNVLATVKSMPPGPCRTAEQGRGPSKVWRLQGWRLSLGGPAGAGGPAGPDRSPMHVRGRESASGSRQRTTNSCCAGWAIL